MKITKKQYMEQLDELTTQLVLIRAMESQVVEHQDRTPEKIIIPSKFWEEVDRIEWKTEQDLHHLNIGWSKRN